MTTRSLRPAADGSRLAVVAGALLLFACAGGPPKPAELDTVNEACANCRMSVSDRRFASQIVAPGAEPQFFDDLGCLKEHLARTSGARQDAAVYVADHRTREWVDARQAVFARRSDLATPMASGLMAHRDSASAREDPDARGSVPVPAQEILAGRATGAGR